MPRLRRWNNCIRTTRTNLVLLPALTLSLSPAEREPPQSVLGLRMIVRPIQSHHIPKTRGTFPLLPGGEGRDEGGCETISKSTSARVRAIAERLVVRPPRARPKAGALGAHLDTVLGFYSLSSMEWRRGLGEEARGWPCRHSIRVCGLCVLCGKISGRSVPVRQTFVYFVFRGYQSMPHPVIFLILILICSTHHPS
jgi:hypothetical protein